MGRSKSKKHKIIILIGESAVGKDTLCTYLVDNNGYERIVTYTTRPPRDNEIDGVDYVDTLEVSTTVSGATLGQTVAIDFDEYSSVIADNITVSEAE